MNQNYLEALFSVGAVFIIILFLVGILISVLYLLTLQNVLKEVSPKNRLVPPTNVWLMFIPLFNLIYPFILYPRIADSIKAEYESRNISSNGDFGRSIGITMPILSLCGWIPILGGLAALTNFILWIIFWSKMSGYKNALKNSINSSGVSSNSELLD